MLRIASCLLVAVMLSTCAISGTFAKYTTSDSATDTARVAKWGVSLQVDGSLFGKNYSDANDNKPTVSTTDSDISVETSDTSKLVAPGAQSDKGLHIALNGTPEVRTSVSGTIVVKNVYLSAGTYAQMLEVTVNEVDFDTEKAGLYTKSGTTYSKLQDSAAYDADENYYKVHTTVVLQDAYYPVVYSLQGATGDVTYTASSNTTCSVDSINGLAAALSQAINNGTAITATGDGHTKTYTIPATNVLAPNTNLATTLKISNSVISWEWEFEGVNDPADTILGLLAADASSVVKLSNSSYVALTAGTDSAVNDYNLETSFSISLTVTQIN